MNCIGPDRNSGPSVTPCGACHPCQEIAGDRHVDVLEMDAASHTGVDDIRELIDGVRYAPASARYKVYIIDEVHMLSKNAFNALLKTLEEPPPHVKFIFATTEVRKLPLTVLSRCQRFDLRRVEPELLATHMATIAEAEGADVETGAMALLARAAEGSCVMACHCWTKRSPTGPARSPKIRSTKCWAWRIAGAHWICSIPCWRATLPPR